MQRGSEIAQYAATIAMGITGALITIVMPGVLLALTQNLGLTTSAAARIATSELFGMMASTLLVGQSLATPNRKWLVAIALAFVIVGNVGSLVFIHSRSLYLWRIVCGLGEGITLAAMGAAAASLSNPDRLFALFMAGNQSMAATFLLALPVIVARGGVKSMFLLLGGVGVVGLVALRWFPKGVKSPTNSTTSWFKNLAEVLKMPTASVGLGALLIVFAGVGIVWPLIGQIAAGRSVASETIASGLALAPIGGVLGGLAAASLGVRFGRYVPVAFGGSALVLSMLAIATNYVGFSICVFGFVFWWVFVTAYLMGIVASADSAGRAAILISATQLGGLAIGPSIAALLIALNDSSTVAVIAGAAVCLAGLSLALYANASGLKSHGTRKY